MPHSVSAVRESAGYTQNLEETYILNALKMLPTGRFLDIGAHDGKSFSSTRALAERGWSGIYIEPDPIVLVSLYENIKQFGNKVEVLPVAIGNHNGRTPFYSSRGDMVGSLVKSHADKWSDRCQFDMSEVDVVTVDTLARARGTQFDFINLDVEGLNWEVFTQFDWNMWRPKCVCIEYDDKINEIASILKSNRYDIVYTSPENIVGVKQGLRWVAGKGFSL